MLCFPYNQPALTHQTQSLAGTKSVNVAVYDVVVYEYPKKGVAGCPDYGSSDSGCNTKRPCMSAPAPAARTFHLEPQTCPPSGIAGQS